MSTTATLVQLAAELALFTVAVAGAGLSLRDGLLGLDRSARLLLVAGFVVLGFVSFGVGSLTIDRADEPLALAAVRCAGGTMVALGALRWAGSRVGRPTLIAGLVTLVVAAVVETLEVDLVSTGLGAEPLVLAAAVVIGAALVVAGRHTIPGRIGTSVAGVLLAVVLMMSFVLSAVISRTVEDEALGRYGDRAGAEATAALAEGELSLQEATLVGAGLSASLGADLAVVADPVSGDVEAARAAISAGVAELAEGLTIDAPIVVVGPDGAPVVGHPTSLTPATTLALGGDPVVREALDVDGPRQGVTAVGEQAFAVAAVPLRGGSGGTVVAAGVVLVARPLDAAYLARRLAADTEPLTLALVTRDSVVATSGPVGLVEAATIARARTAIDADTVEAGGFEAERVVVGRPVAAEGALPQLALVLSTPADGVSRTRFDLYRSLFLVAMVAGLIGIALSVVLGERIGGAIRQLTAAAARIREGDLDARAAIVREDELGELSTTFDAMAVSLHRLTSDLRDAAAEEGRLRSRLESVFAGVTEAVVAADGERRVTELNVAAADLLGLTDGRDVIGRPLDSVVDVVGVDGHPLSLTAPRHRPRLVAGHLRPAARPDAPAPEAVPVVGTVASLQSSGGARGGVVVVLRDIRREQALEAAKQDFLANIGHELRTPLTPIKGYAGVLRRRAPTAEQARDWSDGITAGVERMEHMVDRLVTFAAVTAAGSTGPVTTEPVAVGPLLDDLVAEWRDRLGDDREVRLERDELLPGVRGERAQLHLALGELVDNAVRFSTPGAPIVVGAHRHPGDDQVALTVTDEAGGDTSALEGALDAFVQGEAALSRAHDGLGLGLALTDRVARAHGGRVDIATSPDGTIVSILVPVVTVGAHDGALDPRDTARPTPEASADGEGR